MTRIAIIVGACFLFIWSCRSPNSPLPFRAPNLQTPVATGIFITLETSPEIVGVFGKPSSNPTIGNPGVDRLTSGDVPSRFYLYVPYPNPSNGECAITFELPEQSRVAIYIVPAIFMSQESRIVQFNNATIYTPGGLAIDILLDRNLPPGHHEVIWPGRNSDGDPVPDGFYRIYMDVNGHRLWQDALSLRDPCKAPAGLKVFGANRCR
jgi:hypothetical protein